MPEKLTQIAAAQRPPFLRGEVWFKFRWRQVAERGVKPFAVVDFLQKLVDFSCMAHLFPAREDHALLDVGG